MIGYVKGKVMSNTDTTVLLENNGVGFEINCSISAFTMLMENREGGVYTYMQVKEDGIALFGFSTLEEKSMFLKLITVSGIGAKMGITLLSGMSLKDLALAIATSDVKSLSKIKGLGKKTAERIIVELRESVGEIADDVKVGDLAITPNADTDNAILALISLGYNKSIAVKAVSEAIKMGSSSVEEIIANALRSLA